MEYSNRIGDYSKKIEDISRIQQNRIWPLPRFKRTGQDLVVMERSPIYKSIRISLCTGHCHRVHTEWQWPFSAYIPSWWKNLPRLVRVGSALALPFIISTITYKVVVYGTLQLREQLHSPYFYSTPFYTLWSQLRGWEWVTYSMRVDTNVYSESTKTDHPLKMGRTYI